MPKYHLHQDTSYFYETYEFDLEHFLLVCGVSCITPSPPEFQPYKPRNELGEDSEE
jgi:hypothetical protein